MFVPFACNVILLLICPKERCCPWALSALYERAFRCGCATPLVHLRYTNPAALADSGWLLLALAVKV